MNQRTQGSRLQAAGWASAFALLLSGCGSIPDLKPFADATQAVRSGVVSVGSEFASAIPADMRCSGSGPSAPLCRVKFSDAWKPRVDALGAIGDYSDGLAQVAAAGRDGAARAEQVVGSATTLLTTVGAVVPGAIASVATKGLAELAKARALRSMSEAIEAVHPPVKELFEALDADLATLDRTGQEIAVGTAALADADDKAQVGAAVARAGGAAGALRSVRPACRGRESRDGAGRQAGRRRLRHRTGLRPAAPGDRPAPRREPAPPRGGRGRSGGPQEGLRSDSGEEGCGAHAGGPAAQDHRRAAQCARQLACRAPFARERRAPRPAAERAPARRHGRRDPQTAG